jgi:hypothetical protein
MYNTIHLLLYVQCNTKHIIHLGGISWADFVGRPEWHSPEGSLFAHVPHAACES